MFFKLCFLSWVGQPGDQLKCTRSYCASRSTGQSTNCKLIYSLLGSVDRPVYRQRSTDLPALVVSAPMAILLICV